ncbi:MAG TPA: hypothetical protein VJQ49_05075 [Casimicrobiaceae bacterium]|nr:hypothetical protein [Casimicrobiaceae bacterium]
MCAVAAHLDDPAVIVLDGGANDRVVPRQRDLHAVVLALPEAGAALDIGKQECRDAGCDLHGSAR